MKFLLNETRKKPELERALSKDESRPRLTHAYYEPEKRRLIATDACKLIIVPIEPSDGDQAGFVPAEALKAARKAKPFPVELLVDGDVTLVTEGDTQTWQSPNLGQSPNVDQVMPTDDALSRFTVSLNPTYLLDLAKALGDPGQVSIQFVRQIDQVEGDDVGVFPASLKPMVVRVPNGGEAVGLLMPMRPAC